MNKDNPFIANRADAPMIIDIGDNDYVTLYEYNIETNDIKLDYRYTGNKSPEYVEQLLGSLVIEAFEKALKELGND